MRVADVATMKARKESVRVGLIGCNLATVSDGANIL